MRNLTRILTAVLTLMLPLLLLNASPADGRIGDRSQKKQKKNEPFVGEPGFYEPVALIFESATRHEEKGTGSIVLMDTGFAFISEAEQRKKNADSLSFSGCKWEQVQTIRLDEEASKKRGLPELVVEFVDGDVYRLILMANAKWRPLVPADTEVKMDEAFVEQVMVLWNEKRPRGDAKPTTVSVGMTTEDVIKILGEPVKRIEVASNKVLLGYAHQIITVEDGKVTQMDPVKRER